MRESRIGRSVLDIVYVFRKYRLLHRIVFYDGTVEIVDSGVLSLDMYDAGITCVNVRRA